jgi:formylglycine-generating enzyme required for sulfatase activity
MRIGNLLLMGYSLLSFAFICSCGAPKIKVEECDIAQLRMVKVAKGPFTFGIDAKKMNIAYDYFIMKYEVTNEEYAAFLNSALSKGELSLKDTLVLGTYAGDSLIPKGLYCYKILDDELGYKDGRFTALEKWKKHPVIRISWFGAKAFAKSHGMDLPDEYEWEKAARGNSGYDYPWGNEIDGRRANYFNSKDPFDNRSTPVGFYNGEKHEGFQTIDSPSPYGCYDMAGNAWEYLNTKWAPDMPYFKGGGGSYLYHSAAMTQSWFRSNFGYPFPQNLDRCFEADGFRCVKR